MVRLTSLLLALTMAFGTYAQEESSSSFAYVTKSNVNLRENPTTSSRVVGKANMGDIHRIEENHGAWYRIEISEGPESWYPCISAQFVKVLNNSVVPESALESTYSFDDGNIYGVLYFEKDGKDQWNNEWYQYHLIIKNRELQESGGTGVIDNSSGKVMYLNNIMQPDEYMDYPVVYDQRQSLLWYAGFLWNKDDNL